MKFENIKPGLAKLDKTQGFHKVFMPTKAFSNIRNPTAQHLKRAFASK